MAQQWEGLLEGAAQELKGHLTLERVTASKAGDEIAVFFSSDMLVRKSRFWRRSAPSGAISRRHG